MEQSIEMTLEEKPRKAVVMTDMKMELLIRNYGDSLLRLCTLYLRDPHLAEDAVQDTYIKVWKSWQGFEGRAQEKTWITRIAINTCKNYIRSPWRQHVETTDMAVLLEGGIRSAQAVGDEYEKLNNTMVLMNEIVKLKDRYRLAILLYYYQELPVREIAKVMGKQESTIFTLLKRGREQLKRNLPKGIWEVL